MTAFCLMKLLCDTSKLVFGTQGWTAVLVLMFCVSHVNFYLSSCRRITLFTLLQSRRAHQMRLSFHVFSLVFIFFFFHEAIECWTCMKMELTLMCHDGILLYFSVCDGCDAWRGTYCICGNRSTSCVC